MTERPGQDFSQPGLAGTLATVVYRSRAVQPLSGTELHWLTQVAQSRNKAESITGVMVYDHECFYQWLEGPQASVDRVMHSIRNDPRHTDVEIIDQHPATRRQFEGWSMKLATPGRIAGAWASDLIEAPSTITDGLHEHPEGAPALLIRLSPRSEAAVASGLPAQAKQVLPAPAGAPLMPVLESLIRATVIPGLLSCYANRPSNYARQDVPALARALIAADPEVANKLLLSLQAQETPISSLMESLIEPAARALGDLWQDDSCSDVDVTIGLCRLRNAARLLNAEPPLTFVGKQPPPTVLVVPEPGERHLIGAALDSDMLWHAGWSPQSEFPASDAALQGLVEDRWFDVLDLSLSLAFKREHWLPRVTDTIAKARSASRNPSLVIVVGGRVFAERDDAGAIVGADATSITARGLDGVILEAAAAK